MRDDDFFDDVWWEWADVPSSFAGTLELTVHEVVQLNVEDEAFQAWFEETGDEYLKFPPRDPTPSTTRSSDLHRFWHDGRVQPAAWRHDFGKREPLSCSIRIKSNGRWWVTDGAGFSRSGSLDTKRFPSMGDQWVRAAVLHPHHLVDQMAVATTRSIELKARRAVERNGRPARDDIPYDDPWPAGDECRLVTDEETGILLELTLSYRGEVVTSLETTVIKVNEAFDTSVFEPG